MKKIIFVLAVLLVFSGCSNPAMPSPSEVSEKYKNGFSALATAEYGEDTAETEIIKNGMSISFLLKNPPELSGMSIVLFDEHAEVTYEGMTMDIDTENLPDFAPFLLLAKLFEELSDPEEFALSTASGEIIVQSDDFTAVLSSEDLSLKTAVFPRFDTEFDFEKMEFL